MKIFLLLPIYLWDHSSVHFLVIDDVKMSRVVESKAVVREIILR